MKYIKTLLLLIILSVGVIPLFSQEPATFTGKIIDSETKEPIPLVTIQSSTVYTITNTDGEFDIQPKQVDEQISFTHISYHSQKLDYSKISEIIELKPKTFELAEITITPREMIIKELKEVWNKYMALTKDKKNKEFPESTFYYRQLTSNDNLYTQYIECFFTAPTTICVLNMSLQEGRFAWVNRDDMTHITNYFYNSQVAPFSRKKAEYKNILNAFLCADFEDHYEVYLHQTISPRQDDEVRVYEFIPIHATAKNNTLFMGGKAFVRTKDRAIIRAEVKLPTMGLVFDKKTKITNEDHTFIISYREGVTSYPIVESVQASSKINLSRDGKNRVMQIKSILFANDYTFDQKGKKINQKDNLLKEVINSKYNQEFWDNNPIVKRTKVEQQVLDDFNKEGYFGTMNMVQ
ncbi:MAG: carboxypeptidase-like regulatory domain-containing protein [Tannerella sp.]|jgi:hypothetical protein|nr:carboxypeptidase-like regulatory domain-containing protein [Tannerella sp.]